MKTFRQMLAEAGGGEEPGKYRVHTTSVEEAYMLAERELGAEFMQKNLPDFKKNYKILQNQIQRFSLGKNRAEMPVIRAVDVADFKKALDTGRLDVRAPFYGQMIKNQISPNELEKIAPGEKWVNLGIKDGEKKDDVIKTKVASVEAKKLKPIQTEIYLDKVIAGFKKFGVPKQSSPITKNTMIMSKNFYIIDGHHRWATLTLADSSIKMSALIIPLDIEELLTVSLNYGDAIGNKRNL